MALTKFVSCDNPKCESIGVPESISQAQHNPPYGWLRITLSMQGTGPSGVRLDCCTVECVEAAINKRLTDYDEAL